MSEEPTTIAEIIDQVIEDMKSRIEATTNESSFRNMFAVDSSSACSDSSSDSSTSNSVEGGVDRLIKDIRHKMKRLHKNAKSPRASRVTLLNKKNLDSDEDLPDADDDEKTNLNQKYLKTKGNIEKICHKHHNILGCLI